MNTSTDKLHTRKYRLWGIAAILLLLLAAFCLYRGCLLPLDEGISIGGVEIGGLPPVKARQTLTAALEDTLLTQELSVRLPEETLTLSPEDCGFQVKVSKALLDARHATAGSEFHLLSYLKADEEAIRSRLEAYAAQYDTTLTQPDWSLEGNAQDLSTELFDPAALGQTLAVTMGTPEQHLDCAAALGDILFAASDAVTLCAEGQYQVVPVIQPDELPMVPDAAAIAGEFCSEPVSDSVDRENYTFVYGTYGTLVDADVLSEQIRQAAYGETIRIPLQYPEPEILGQDAYFPDVLGAYETRHTNDQNRNTNLQIQCDALNGLVLQPGETFSMNGLLGERTEEKGYKPAPGYSGNRLVNTPGGGVCQGTTTLYNCVLLADLEVVFRACHGVRVGYVPLGLDAAVNFLTTDFQFRNNFHFPIQIKAWMEDEHIKMQILGIDEKDYYIKMETGSGEDEYAYYARSYKCKYDKETNELISRDIEAFSTYYKDIG